MKVGGKMEESEMDAGQTKERFAKGCRRESFGRAVDEERGITE